MVSEAPMPAVYIPHGGGPAFFMDGPMGQMFRPMSEFLSSVDTLLPARPTAILVVSAHWEDTVVTVSAAARPPLLFDYYGFPPETYELSYGAPGAPALAETTATLLRDAGVPTRLDLDRGWDHGVFVPLKVMYPAAEIPVLAMSLVAGLDPLEHLRIGEALRPLRHAGVLIVGSGMSYHNLRQMDGAKPPFKFHQWLEMALDGDGAHRRAHLAQWAQAPSGRASHPREEHLLPLMVCSGAGSDIPGNRLWAGNVGDTAVQSWAFA